MISVRTEQTFTDLTNHKVTHITDKLKKLQVMNFRKQQPYSLLIWIPTILNFSGSKYKNNGDIKDAFPLSRGKQRIENIRK
jgi:hypothetical protein